MKFQQTFCKCCKICQIFENSARRSCRSQTMLKSAHLLAKIGADTAEHERHFARLNERHCANFHRAAPPGSGGSGLTRGKITFPPEASLMQENAGPAVSLNSKTYLWKQDRFRNCESQVLSRRLPRTRCASLLPSCGAMPISPSGALVISEHGQKQFQIRARNILAKLSNIENLCFAVNVLRIH